VTRKLVNFESASLEALELLAADKHMSFQELMNEAVVDLLKKHGRPTTMKEMFRQSLGRTAGKAGRTGS
jgi:hypothetical protein